MASGLSAMVAAPVDIALEGRCALPRNNLFPCRGGDVSSENDRAVATRQAECQRRLVRILRSHHTVWGEEHESCISNSAAIPSDRGPRKHLCHSCLELVDSSTVVHVAGRARSG